MVEKISLHVNGKSFSVAVDDADTPLLYVLRDALELNNPHFGCGLAQCGACMVLLNGAPARSCVLPVSRVADSTITTLEGLGTPQKPHPVQQAFIDEQSFFCGYCLNGWVMTAAAFVKKHPRATDAQIREAFAGLKCRCGSHMSILRAVKRLTEVA
jgi:aerobic-type carbon monoxide dehydrogenase small subunit (CoxS/CutS family)